MWTVWCAWLKLKKTMVYVRLMFTLDCCAGCGAVFLVLMVVCFVGRRSAPLKSNWTWSKWSALKQSTSSLRTHTALEEVARGCAANNNQGRLEVEHWKQQHFPEDPSSPPATRLREVYALTPDVWGGALFITGSFWVNTIASWPNIKFNVVTFFLFKYTTSFSVGQVLTQWVILWFYWMVKVTKQINGSIYVYFVVTRGVAKYIVSQKKLLGMLFIRYICRENIIPNI